MSNGIKLYASVATVAVVCAFALPAIAQPMPTEYIIKLSPTELDSVGKGLGFMPFNEAAPLINKIREQVLGQQPKPDKPAASPGDDKK